jgi:putative drug exporter of the RND superfamily
LSVFFHRLGEFVARRWIVVLAVWIALVAAVRYCAPRWDDVTRDGDFAYLPDDMTSVRGTKLLEAAFPDYFSKSTVAIVLARDTGRLTTDDLAVAERLLATFPPSPNGDSDAKTPPRAQSDDPANPITAVWSYDTPIIGEKLVSPPSEHGQAALLVFHLRNEFMAIDNMDLVRRMTGTLAEQERSPKFPKGLKLGLTGSAAIGSDMLFAAQESIRNTEWATIVMVVLILLLVYRAPGLVLVPVLTIGASVWLAMGLVASAAALAESNWIPWFDFKTFKTTRIFIIVILFGAGTDFCLFLISRYKEELRRGLGYREAAAEALGRVGSALAGSAGTTIFGLAMMFFADFGKFRNSGPAIAMCLAVTLFACVTLAPALLCASRGAVFWPWGVGQAAVADDSRERPTSPRSRWTGSLWEPISRAIVARPGLILVASLLVLLPLMRPARTVTRNLPSGKLVAADWHLASPVTYDLLAELSPQRPSVRGTHLLWRYFPADQTGPLGILIRQPGVDFASREGRRKISELTHELFDLEFVDAAGNTVRPITAVRSLTEPMGDAPGSFNPLSAAGRRKLVTLRNPRTLATFVSHAPSYAGEVTRLDLISIFAPFSRQSVDLLNHVEALLRDKAEAPNSEWRGAEISFVGTTAGIRDLAAVTASDQVRVQLLVVIAVLAVLVVILRRPMVCVYLILTVLLGYGVTIGVTELIFSWVYGDAFTGLDWKVPLFLFVILVAIGEDYNIYLVTRVFEEQGRLGPVEGLRVAVLRTGGIITSCGVIMAGTFASMIAGTLRAMQELGFALALGVLLDTFIIRTILVPAFLALLARREETPLPDAHGSDTGATRPHGRPETISV